MNNVPAVFPLKNTPKDEYGTSKNAHPLTDRDAPLAAEPIHLEEKLEKLQNEMKMLSIKNEGLQNQIGRLKFGFHRFISLDDDMNYYTGMSSHHFS